MSEENAIQVRRRYIPYFSYLGWAVLSGARFFGREIAWNLNDFIWLLSGLTAFAVLVRISIQPAYILKKGDSLTIYYDYFKSTVINLSTIEKVVLESSPFSRSYFLRKGDGSRTEFSYFDLNDNDFNKFKNSLSIPIE